MTGDEAVCVENSEGFKESLIKCSLSEMEQIRPLPEMASVKTATGVAELRPGPFLRLP
jgi:hypothetical protein